MGWWDLHWVFTGLLLRSIFRIGNVPTWWEGRSQLDLDSNRSFATRQTVSYLSAMTNCVGGIAAELLFESLSKFSNSKLHRSTSPPNQENICDENFSQASKGYWRSISLWFCPRFCPCPHVLPPMFALALALYFALIFQDKIEGKGKGKRWGQNMGERARAKI